VDGLIAKNINLVHGNLKTALEAKDSGIYHMLEFNKCDDLATMYTSIKHIKAFHSTMIDLINCYLREQECVLAAKVITQADDAVTYVKVNLFDWNSC
jgi:hypothetical protein